MDKLEISQALERGRVLQEEGQPGQRTRGLLEQRVVHTKTRGRGRGLTMMVSGSPLEECGFDQKCMGNH